MRDALREIDETNSLLKDWRRRFLLDTLYRPVRARVISLNIAHLRLTNFKQQMLFDRSVQGKHDEMLSEALRLANNLTPMPNDFRSSRKNYYCEVSLDKLLELLVEWPASMDNRRELDDLVWAVKIQQDSGKINKAVLVFMDWEPSLQRPTTRNRSILRDKPVAGLAIEDHNINDLWQGTDVGKGVKYPGDSAMCFEDALTVQIHSVKPQFPRKDFLPVTALAVITPANLTGVIVEV
jgi:hypothetical protein